jgi:hypothetical protein
VLGHSRRKFFELARLRKMPIAIEAVQPIDVLFAIGREINGIASVERLPVRGTRSKPLGASPLRLQKPSDVWVPERIAIPLVLLLGVQRTFARMACASCFAQRRRRLGRPSALAHIAAAHRQCWAGVGTEHFRNVLRHKVVIEDAVLTLRIDESLNFANARAIEDFIQDQASRRPALRQVALQCTAINEIDGRALERLELIVQWLEAVAIRLHLSEVKVPMLDRVRHADRLGHLTGDVFLTHHQAMMALSSQITARATWGGTANANRKFAACSIRARTLNQVRRMRFGSARTAIGLTPVGLRQHDVCQERSPDERARGCHHHRVGNGRPFRLARGAQKDRRFSARQ